MIEIKKEQEPSELITHRKTAYTTYSEDADINTDLNVTLNLNCNRFGLVDSRRDALQRMLKELQAKHSSGDIKRYCAKLLNAYRENSPKTPYVGILIHWLERHC